MGGGGLLSLTEIVIADLVPLHQRGAFVGISELFRFTRYFNSSYLCLSSS